MTSLRFPALGFGAFLLAASLGACGSDDEAPTTNATGASGVGGAAGAAGGAGGTGGAAGSGVGGSSDAGTGGAAGSGIAGSSDAGTGGAAGSGVAGAGGAAGSAGGAAGAGAGAGTNGGAGAGAGQGGGAGEAGSGGQAGACLYPSTPSKTCSKTEDCAVVRGPSQCAPDWIGLQAVGAAQFEAEAAYFRSCAPPPPCAASLPPTADDGSFPLQEGDEATVRCDAGQCRSSFLTDCTAPPTFDRACTTSSDCVAVDQPDCCSTRVRGIASGDADNASKTFLAFVDSCRSCEVVDCAGVGRVADDDSVPPDGMPAAEPALICDAGTCKTTFKPQ
jgi:hypothetical protein